VSQHLRHAHVDWTDGADSSVEATMSRPAVREGAVGPGLTSKGAQRESSFPKGRPSRHPRAVHHTLVEHMYDRQDRPSIFSGEVFSRGVVQALTLSGGHG
jgi:hypothetical protein